MAPPEDCSFEKKKGLLYPRKPLACYLRRRLALKSCLRSPLLTYTFQIHKSPFFHFMLLASTFLIRLTDKKSHDVRLFLKLFRRLKPTITRPFSYISKYVFSLHLTYVKMQQILLFVGLVSKLVNQICYLILASIAFVLGL